MEKYRLVFPNKDYENEWHDVVKEFEENDEIVIPAALKGETNEYGEYLKDIYNKSKGINLKEGRVPSSIYFLVNDKNRILGAIDIRHSLNDYLFNYGGNIGYGIRPTERGKGYGKEMLRQAIEKCRELSLDKVLITCDKNNIASANTMKSNGAIFENEVLEGNKITQRYWIKID